MGEVKLQGVEVENVDEFKYVDLTVQGHGECGREVTNGVDGKVDSREL